MSSCHGHLDNVKFLLSKGINVNGYNDSAVRGACCKGQLEIVKFLVDEGANIHANNDNAIELASENGHIDTVKFLALIDFNVDVNKREKATINDRFILPQRLYTCYDSAIKKAIINGHIEIVKFLLKREKHYIHLHGESALSLAESISNTEIAEFLVDAGAK